MHDTTLYDQNSQINAYDQMISGVQPVLDANPSIQVTIDLHRDGIGGDGRLVTEIDGQDVAQLMIVNGISAEYNGETGQMEEVSYLYNPCLLYTSGYRASTAWKCGPGMRERTGV